MILFQSDGSREIRDLAPGLNWDEDAAHIGPHIVYRIEKTKQSDETVDNQLNFNLKWLREETCSSHFFCPELEGNVCGDFGLSLDSIAGGKVNGTSVCFEDSAYEGGLKTDEKMSIRLWTENSESSYRALCYFWCTSFGDIPAAKPNVDDNKDLIGKLVSRFIFTPFFYFFARCNT